MKNRTQEKWQDPNGFRGGSWYIGSKFIRVWSRNLYDPNFLDDDLGLRIVRNKQ